MGKKGKKDKRGEIINAEITVGVQAASSFLKEICANSNAGSNAGSSGVHTKTQVDKSGPGARSKDSAAGPSSALDKRGASEDPVENVTTGKGSSILHA